MSSILVIGGTGMQGRGFIDFVQKSNASHLKDAKLKIITRNSASKEAIELRKRGVEVLRGSLLDEAFLVDAMRNVDILYINTFSDHDGSEFRQGMNLGNAAVNSNVSCVIFSGGESMGIDEMDNKSKIENYLRSLPIKKVIYLHIAFFYEEIVTKRGTKRVQLIKDPEKYIFSIPLKENQKVAFISSYDIGVFGASLVVNKLVDKYSHGAIIPIAGDMITPKEFAQLFTKVTGKEAQYKEMSLDFFRNLPIAAAHLIVKMYLWYHAGCPGDGHGRDPAATRKICPQVRNCEEWLRTGGVDLIKKAAYQDTIWFRFSQVLLRMYVQLYGFYVSLRLKLILKPSQIKKNV